MLKTFSRKIIKFTLIIGLWFDWSKPLLNFAAQNSTINLSSGASALVVNTPITGFNGTLAIQTPSSTSIQGATGSCTIAFSNGSVVSGLNSYVLTGTYNPTGTDSLGLGSSDTVLAYSGQVPQPITASGTVSNPSVLQGQPSLTGPLTLSNASSALKIQITNKLNQNVALNSGTVVLGNDLCFGPGSFFTGTGTVNCAGYKLEIASNSSPALSANLTLSNAANIVIDGYTAISGTWTFADAGGSSFINCNGAVLDLSSGGQITIASNHTLYITNAYIRGLGTSLGKFNLNAVGATLKLCNVTLEINGQYTHNSGQIYFWGTGGTLVSANNAASNYYFDVSSTGTLTVDHTVLSYQTLGWSDINPLTWTNQGTQQNLINGGLILPKPTGGTFNGPVTIDQTTVAPKLYGDQPLSSTATLNLTNSLGTTQSMTIFGQGSRIIFPSTGTYLSIANSLTATFTSTVFENYSPAGVLLGTSSAIAFGVGTIVKLSTDFSIASATQAINFTGSGTIEGNGQTITISVANGITVTGANTLTIKNATLICTNASAIACLSNTSTIVLENCTLIVDPSLTISTGAININGTSIFRGSTSATPDTLSTLTWSSGGKLTVNSRSTLRIDGSINFVYQANPTVNSDTYKQSKRHLLLADPSSRLELAACTLTSTTTALALDYGKLKIVDQVTLSVSTATGANMELGSALELFINPGATLIVNGPVSYNPSTYP